MKYYLCIILLSTLALALTGQSGYIGLFHSEDISQPELHADGIFKTFIESDNQLRRGNTEQAILVLDNAIAQNPFFAETYLKRSTLLLRLGRYAEARKDLNRAMQLNPYLAQIYTPNGKVDKLELLALSMERHEDFIENQATEESGYHLEQSIKKKLDRDAGGALMEVNSAFRKVSSPQALMYDLRGNIHFLLENYHQAIEDYNQAILLEPNVAAYYFNRGVAQLFTYNRAAACEDLQTSERLGYPRSTEKLKYFCYY